MAETLISPGVLARENDQSQITSQPVQAGAAVVGPTVLGRVGIPKLVTSYSEYLANYGSTFTSGSDTYTFFTSISAYNYFNNGGTSLLVTRVASGSWAPASTPLIPAIEDESGALTVGASILGSLTSGGSGGTAATYAAPFVTTTGTGSDSSGSFVVSTDNGKLLTTADDLLSEFVAGTNPTNAGTNQYTNVTLTQGSVNSAIATVDVTGTTAPTITGITVTNPGSGYAAGVIDIAAGALGTGQLINAQDVLSISNGAAYVLGAVTGPFTVAQTSTTGTGTGATFTITGDGTNVSALAVASIGTGHAATNVITISAADLVTAGFTGATGNLEITLAAANVQDSSAAQATITVSNLLTEITSASVTLAGTGYAIGNQLTIPAASLGGAGATDAVFTLSAANITNANVFTLETISQGDIMNSDGPENSNGALASGSAQNIRWEIQAPNTGSGVFSLIIRQGNDNSKSKSILEVFPNVSLDPKQSNYISRIVGDMTDTVRNATSADVYIQPTGSFRNASRYVRVKSVDLKTPDYFDNSGIAKPEFTGSIPSAGSGSFSGAVGDNIGGKAGIGYYDAISDSDSQGLGATEADTSAVVLGSYPQVFNLLGNKDDYRYNILSAPGLYKASSNWSSALTLALSTVSNRGDAILIMDLVDYGSTVTQVTTQAASVDNSYAASYWPWVQINDPDSAQLVWCPASALLPGVYAYNDKAAEAWFAPAGINRGGLSTVVQAERKLTQTNRDDLYTGKVNPIATFPGRGVVVFGQKTLQSQASALDRVNVRRLLIELKSYISQIADNLVFEQNTAATRNNFLAQVNPYLESVQQRQGLYAFKVVMDASNNGPDVVDRNQMVGAIYLQPTKTAEFIYLDFNILPTGAQFPS
jgi:hypothetical protein